MRRHRLLTATVAATVLLAVAAPFISRAGSQQANRPASPVEELNGHWNMLCRSKSPEAFEPLTLSGRFSLKFRDGEVTGSFDDMVATGRLASDGTLEGTAQSPTARARWRGTMTEASPSAPKRVRGYFQFDDGDCFDGRWWSE